MRVKTGLLLLLLPLFLLAAPACQQASTDPVSEEAVEPGSLAKPDQDTYTEGDAVTVTYSNLPGNDQDWISVIPASEPDDTYGSEWFYTGGETEGTYTFEGLAPGEYEVRVYFNWPEGDYEVQDRYSFTIEAAEEEAATETDADAELVSLEKESFAADEAIAIEYSGLPGNDQDWITLVKASDPDDTYGEWFYTDGQVDGTYTFEGLEPGEYEIRVYYNWPDGDFDVQERIPVVVE
jgi:hypothetical protein